MAQDDEEIAMTYWDLFFCFLKIGTFSFGGGYAALPLIQGQVVGHYQWLSMQEFTDLVTISQMTPGSIAVNAATFVGVRMAGLPGAVIATAGCVLPACFIVTLVAKLYLKYRDMTLLAGVFDVLRPAVVALIAVSGADILMSALWNHGAVIMQLDAVNWRIAALFAASLTVLTVFRLNPILVMLLAGVAEAGMSLLE